MTHQIDWRSMFKDVLSRMRNAGESNEMGARWMSTAANEAVAAALAAKDAEIEKLKAAMEAISRITAAASNSSDHARLHEALDELDKARSLARSALKGDAA